MRDAASTLEGRGTAGRDPGRRQRWQLGLLVLGLHKPVGSTLARCRAVMACLAGALLALRLMGGAISQDPGGLSGELTQRVGDLRGGPATTRLGASLLCCVVRHRTNTPFSLARQRRSPAVRLSLLGHSSGITRHPGAVAAA